MEPEYRVCPAVRRRRMRERRSLGEWLLRPVAFDVQYGRGGFVCGDNPGR
jgi:hypothetical protein